MKRDMRIAVTLELERSRVSAMSDRMRRVWGEGLNGSEILVTYDVCVKGVCKREF